MLCSRSVHGLFISCYFHVMFIMLIMVTMFNNEAAKNFTGHFSLGTSDRPSHIVVMLYVSLYVISGIILYAIQYYMSYCKFWFAWEPSKFAAPLLSCCQRARVNTNDLPRLPLRILIAFTSRKLSAMSCIGLSFSSLHRSFNGAWCSSAFSKVWWFSCTQRIEFTVACKSPENKI